jgi:putative hydrolase of the HAD superfamily
VLCDLDDTLYEEMTFVASGFGAVAAHLSERFHLNSEELFSAMMEILLKEGRGKVFDKLLERYELFLPNLVSELVGTYRSHKPQIHLYPEVMSTFGALKMLGMKLGVVTDGMHAVQRNKIASLKLPEFVDTIVCTDELGQNYWKPHPAAFQRALETLTVQPNEAVYVGNDPTKDFAGPHSIGMLTAHVFHDASLAHPCCGADAHIANLTGILQLVTESWAA